MIQKLQKDGYPDDVIREVMSFLEELSFCRWQFLHRKLYSCNKSRKSPRQIVFELQQKGVDKDTISRMLEEAPINEDDTVRALLKKKTGGQIPADWKERQKLADFLGRKGFSFDVIQRVLRESTDD